MKELTRRGLIFGGAALAAVGVFAGVDHVASSTFVKNEPPLGPDATVDIVEFDETGKRVGTVQKHKVRKTLAEWQAVLTTPQFVVTRKAATEIPYSGELLNEHRAGTSARRTTSAWAYCSAKYNALYATRTWGTCLRTGRNRPGYVTA